MTQPDVGDWRIATLTVVPFDATTAVTLAVIAPDGTTTAPAVASSDGGATWASNPFELTTAGEWLERWTVTGTGTGKQRNTVLVAPDPTAVPAGARVYASTADLATWLRAAPPSGARRALAEASRLVDEMLLTACYDVDDDGMPTAAAVIAALLDATCAQADWARASGDTNLVGAGRPASFTLGKLAVQRQTLGGTGGAGVGPRGDWSPQAWRLLQQAGLTGGGPQTW